MRGSHFQATLFPSYARAITLAGRVVEYTVRGRRGFPMVDERWLAGFRNTVGDFQRRQTGNGHAVSIKVRVESGCFHREHSPQAYKILDARAQKASRARGDHRTRKRAGATGLLGRDNGSPLSLAKSVVELVTEIFKARATGIKKGDHPNDALVLIVRRVDEKNEYREDVILRVGHTDAVDSSVIEKELKSAIKNISKRR
jgi:hypothetical protein